MQLTNKVEQLKSLKNKITDEIKGRGEEIWFFPEYKEVKGYLGTQNIIFLAINPSFGNFPSRRDEQYYWQLKHNGLANAHLTDVFKQRARDWKILAKDEDITEEAKRFLIEEIEIIDPVLIVLVGKLYEKFCKKILGEIGANVETITIKSYTYRFKSREELESIIKENMIAVKKKYSEWAEL